MISFFRVPNFPTLWDLQHDPEAARRVILRGYHVMLWRGRACALPASVILAWTVRYLIDAADEQVTPLRVLVFMLNAVSTMLFVRAIYLTWKTERIIHKAMRLWESLPPNFKVET